MDTEQQIRHNFLDEAEEYFDLMESNLLGLANTAVEPQKVDSVLRSAHSIKGGAAMMGFDILSQVAHRLEDFLKILRVRYVAQTIDVEVETLLLGGVDCLRNLASVNRQLLSTEDAIANKQQRQALRDRLEPVFDKLQSHLGDLEASDENALLTQNEDFDPAVLIFEEGVDGVLDRFEAQLEQLEITELAQELTVTAQELMGFGNMASLEPFVKLCESVQQELTDISPPEIMSLAEEALKTWRRSHALVLRGSIERLPSRLSDYASSDPDNGKENLVLKTTNSIDSGFIESDFDPLDSEVDLDDLQSAFTIDVPEAEAELESDFDPLDSEVDLDGLQSAFTMDVPEAEAELESDFDPLDSEVDLDGLQSAFTMDVSDTPTIIQPEVAKLATSEASSKTTSFERTDKMVRVPASQLKQFNTLFEQLVLNRNSITLRLEQLENVISLMSQRMSQMESSNTRLKQWYDRASIEGLLNKKEQLVSTTTHQLTGKHNNFDSLEMDRYSDIHLICQEQIETIVQLQEVATDIELGVQEVHQSVRDLHYTTKSMQGNVTRTQMLPFADAVKRIPRIIRDLNLQSNKKVNLQIVGEKTFIDRLAIEALADPLMHLVRNSFDHGIEDPATRLAAGKVESGTISIQAKNVGTYSVITVSDDGGGIALDKICDRVCQMGLTQEEVAKIPEAELLDFIFEPGFSTAREVTQLSGRGVGMDVVRTNLKEVRGDIRVDTKPGLGTTFTLKIPFSLSILRVAIVEQGNIIFAIPASNIRELISRAPESILSPENDRAIIWNQQEIPLIEIDKILIYRHGNNTESLSGNPSINRPITLVVGDGKSCTALKISRFWNEQESTTRSIDSPIPLPPGVISSVVFGDGKVIPLIDPIALSEASFKNDYIDDSSQPALTETTNSVPTVKTILIVDDSINVRRYLGLTLEKAGYRVEQAKDGREAVDKLLGGLIVQGVICDVEMPRLDGYGVLEEIKERSQFQDLPIAMLTSRSNDKHRKLAFNLGASAYFSKPYNEQQLLDKLAEILN